MRPIDLVIIAALFLAGAAVWSAAAPRADFTSGRQSPDPIDPPQPTRDVRSVPATNVVDQGLVLEQPNSLHLSP
jgi:hypothetical protein